MKIFRGNVNPATEVKPKVKIVPVKTKRKGKKQPDEDLKPSCDLCEHHNLLKAHNFTFCPIPKRKISEVKEGCEHFTLIRIFYCNRNNARLDTIVCVARQ